MSGTCRSTLRRLVFSLLALCGLLYFSSLQIFRKAAFKFVSNSDDKEKQPSEIESKEETSSISSSDKAPPPLCVDASNLKD